MKSTKIKFLKYVGKLTSKSWSKNTVGRAEGWSRGNNGNVCISTLNDVARSFSWASSCIYRVSLK